ncbi:DinB family protein [Pararhodobacter zhoushanensis]|uniref:DinB family protein n=1 Tax=Pararhodobacter zhoushanensis TaxID=2479545 RepID=A0ABT3H472_9RHOB|nr:DinB family protein [Pararhodobacter zhoushanensis]MCW1934619.1 DinB family protein [Pararhodobacter zhoushanensis]
MRDPFLTMALNNAWANATLYGAIAGLTDADFAAPRPGFFPSLKATLNHIWKVDLYYIDALEEGELGPSVFYDTPDHTSVAPLAAAQAEADMRLASFCQSLTLALLDAPRVTQRPSGPVTERVGPVLLHLFQHQIHHRGQAHTMIGDAGIAPPQLDDFHLDYGRVPSAQAYFG